MTHTFNLVPNQQITPERFFSAVNSYQLTEAIKSAIELEIFTAITEGNTTSETISKRCQATERGVRILCDFLTIHGFLTKQGRPTPFRRIPPSSQTGIRLLKSGQPS